MQFDKVGALMFYDNNNALVGSIGIDAGMYMDEDLQRIVRGALQDVFSTEETARIAYFTAESHHLVIHDNNDVETTTYGSGLVQVTEDSRPSAKHGLIEKDLLIKYKIEAIKLLDNACGSYEDELNALVDSLMDALGVKVERGGQGGGNA